MKCFWCFFFRFSLFELSTFNFSTQPRTTSWTTRCTQISTDRKGPELEKPVSHLWNFQSRLVFSFALGSFYLMSCTYRCLFIEMLFNFPFDHWLTEAFGLHAKVVSVPIIAIYRICGTVNWFCTHKNTHVKETFLLFARGLSFLHFESFRLGQRSITSVRVKVW